MLILTRRTKEVICIGDHITVTVLGVKGNQVRVGVIAPSEMPVHRKEIYEQIKDTEGTVRVGQRQNQTSDTFRS